MKIKGNVTLRNRGLRGLLGRLDGFRDRGIRTMMGTAALVACALSPLQAGVTLVLSTDGLTVYDATNNITWLADFNLAARSRFGLPICSGSSIDTKTCVNPSGSMRYQATAAWVAAMNTANYLGHNNWQLPTTPAIDNTGCEFVGPHGNSFAFECAAGALGSLYYKALGLKAPNTAVPLAANTVGPFSNLQPYYYWSQTSGNSGGYATFSFNTGFQDSNTPFNFMYVLPMIPGKLPGTPAATGQGLQVNPGGQTVYDPETNVTWLANANLAATNTFGLPTCTNENTPRLCVGQDGAMSWDSASQFITNMNNGAGYLGHTNWQRPPVDPNCPNYGCGGTLNPMGNIFYEQLGFSEGTPVVVTPNVTVGPFHNLQPYIYWECGADTVQATCQYDATIGFEWSFSFGNGFLGTDVLADDYYATAYFVGTRSSTNGPEIAEVANAEGESPAIAPNTWLEIKGVNLAPAGDSRIWQTADFTGNQMPVALDKVSVTVNGRNAYVYYISPTQINVLTPPDAMSGAVPVVVTNNGAASASFTAQAQATSPSFFVFNGGPSVAATHANGSLIGPTTLYPGATTPAKPGEIIVLYANGFGPSSTPVQSGSVTQSGSLSPLPVISIGGKAVAVSFAGLVAPGEFQFNVTVPASLANGDQAVTATYGAGSTQAGTLITIHN